jgi:hypothetical protein
MTGKIVDLDAERIAQAEKEARIIELRRTGATWELIAKATGYANASGAHKAYQKALGRIIEPKIEELRATEIDRLDRLQFAIWERAKEGDIKAIDAVLRILDRRVRILGLDAPTKIQAEIVTYDGSILEEHTQRVIELVRSTRVTESDMGSDTSETGTVTDE